METQKSESVHGCGIKCRVDYTELSRLRAVTYTEKR